MTTQTDAKVVDISQKTTGLVKKPFPTPEDFLSLMAKVARLEQAVARVEDAREHDSSELWLHMQDVREEVRRARVAFEAAGVRDPWEAEGGRL